ncbi:MAG: tRNA (adenosine(37)-N6)-dimethylallyltransferase MiaA [Candidatus Omnitrophota bacterium]
MKEKIFFLVGPTAVGKTAAAINLAKKINGEIISCDSMQIYKGMDIITSKPPKSLLKKVPHHLIGMISPIKEYDVSRYRKDALTKIKLILKKGKVPIFVGGTGLYLSILVDGIFDCQPEDAKLRERLYKEAKKSGSEKLHLRLKKIDPAAAVKIHPNDTRRIVRALEVFKVTGQPISELQKQRSGLAKDYDVRIFCLNMAREKLYQRIDARVDKMFKEGLLREVKKLFKLKLSKTARFAIGIQELKGYFEGKYDLGEAKRLMKRNSRHYAKRQLTWFRKDKRIKWVELGKLSI